MNDLHDALLDDGDERALFARRADAEVRSPRALDVDELFVRIDRRHDGAVRRARVFGVARVVTLANAFAAAAAFFALMRGLPPEAQIGTHASGQEGAPNMSMVGASSEERSSILACLLAGGMSGGEPMCFAPTAISASPMQTSMPESQSVLAATLSTPTNERLSCIDEVTCEVVGP